MENLEEKWQKIIMEQEENTKRAESNINNNFNNEDVDFLKSLNIKQKALLRIFMNLKPYLLVDEVLYISYIGEEANKDSFNQYFINYKIMIENMLKKHFNIKEVKSDKILNKQRISWLNELIENVKAKEIKISIVK